MIRRISLEEFHKRCEGAVVIADDEFGPKVLRTPDGEMLKLFRRKRLISTAAIRPYAARFARASRKLQRLGVPAPVVIELFRVRAIRRDVVVYRELDGAPLREAVADKARLDELIERLGRFLAMLHARGVYFRGLHFGNVLVQPDRTFALIDLSEASFRRGPLPLPLRARNFRPLTRYAEDRAAIESFGAGRFVDIYAQAAELSDSEASRLRAMLERLHPLFAGPKLEGSRVAAAS